LGKVFDCFKVNIDGTLKLEFWWPPKIENEKKKRAKQSKPKSSQKVIKSWQGALKPFKSFSFSFLSMSSLASLTSHNANLNV